MKKTWMPAVFLLAVLFIALLPGDLAAQCAMCRASIENSISNGQSSVGAGLNKGIVYLMLMPYLSFAIIAYFWYRHSKRDRQAQEMLAKRLSGI